MRERRVGTAHAVIRTRSDVGFDDLDGTYHAWAMPDETVVEAIGLAHPYWQLKFAASSMLPVPL